MHVACGHLGGGVAEEFLCDAEVVSGAFVDDGPGPVSERVGVCADSAADVFVDGVGVQVPVRSSWEQVSRWCALDEVLKLGGEVHDPVLAAFADDVQPFTGFDVVGVDFRDLVPTEPAFGGEADHHFGFRVGVRDAGEDVGVGGDPCGSTFNGDGFEFGGGVVLASAGGVHPPEESAEPGYGGVEGFVCSPVGMDPLVELEQCDCVRVDLGEESGDDGAAFSDGHGCASAAVEVVDELVE